MCNQTKQININEDKAEAFTTKVNTLAKGHQKLSIMSSKPKNSNERSNKASPGTVNIG